jgi:hypothetical protein
MVFRVVLEYPNGRTHDAILNRADAPKPGTVFAMHGHTWQVTRLVNSRHTDRFRRTVIPADESTRYVCVRVD